MIIRLLRIYARPTLSQLVSQIRQPAQPQSQPISSSLELEPAHTHTEPVQEAKPSLQTTTTTTTATPKLSQGSLLTPPPSQPKKETPVQKVSAPSSNAPAFSEAAAIDTLLQFAVVEFSGVLTKEPKHG